MTTITKMRLKGFKSFAKPIDLEFGKSFSVVLGPNGSGKSNIMDALCFVLGKISAKSMRAEKSANLIFNGGKKGSPMKEAEVAIFFDNNKNEFPIDGKEVKISRVLRQTGQSVYKINDETRTRQQILELLAAAKIDPNGHNIILQGDIVHFMEMRTEERREVIEEIAGIAVYEDRKAKALNELTKVDGRLNEATIIMTEREAYLRELKKERDQAMKYKEFEKNIQSNKATFLHMQIAEKEKRKEEIESKIKKHESHREKIQKNIQETEEKIAAKKKELETIAQSIEEKGERESIAVQKELEVSKTEMVKNQERLSTCKNEIEKIEERKKQLLATITDVEKTIVGLQESKKELEEKKKELENKEKKVSSEISQFKAKQGITDTDDFDKIEQEIDTVAHQLQDLQTKHHALLQEKFQKEAKIAQLAEKIQAIVKVEKGIDLVKVQKEVTIVAKELGKRLAEETSLAAQLSDAKAALLKKEEQLFVLQARNAGVRTSLMSNAAVKKILSLKNPGVFGSVAQLGKVDKQYALALEVAAGSRLQNIVVKDDKVAADCIKLLKREKLGTATFLPVNKMKARIEPNISGQGVVGKAIDLVSFDNKFRNIFSFVLGNAVVVKDLNVARRIGIGKARMVTLDGDLTEVSGAMIGGFRHKSRGLSFQEKESGDLAILEKETEKLRKLREMVEKRRSENQHTIDELRQKKSVLEAELLKAEKSVGSLDLPALRKEKNQLEESPVFATLQTVEKNLADATKQMEQLRQQREKAKASLKDLRHPEVASKFEKLEQKRQRLREDLVQANTEMKNIEMQLSNIYVPEKEKTMQIVRQHEKETTAFLKEAKELNDLLQLQKKELKTKEGKSARFHKEYKDLFVKRNKVSEEIQKRESNARVEEMKIRDIEQRMNEKSIVKAKIVGELEGLQHEYEEFKGVPLRRQVSMERLKDDIRKFEQLLGQMGNVNLRALEVYEDIRKEYDSLLQKVDKLKIEKDNVLEMIQDIESKKTDLFVKTFNVIAKNFSRIFSSLSTKDAEAQLYLEDKENPLTAGVDIRVRIAGNKFLDIKSLSGGEKTMAALAFIFAIQEHSPGSFYILDEVDAALDKKNSELLSKLLSKYAEQAQYILISHNDAVISEAEQIYGVSMQENGMSKVISLRV